MATNPDNFNRADNTDLGANWAEDNGDWQIVSNTLRQLNVAGNYRKCRWVGPAMDSNDYDVEINPGSSNNNGTGVGAFGRGAASATVTYYGFHGYGGDAFYLEEVTAGSASIIATGSSMTSGTNYDIRIRCNGTALTGFVNDVQDVTGSDSSLTSGSVGCSGYGIAGGTTGIFDNFLAADLVAAAHPPLVRIPQHAPFRAAAY